MTQWGVLVTGAAVQSQKAVTAYFSSKQLLPFGFAEHPRCAIHKRGH